MKEVEKNRPVSQLNRLEDMIENMSLTDERLLTLALQDNLEAAQLILRIILKDDSLKVADCEKGDRCPRYGGFLKIFGLSHSICPFEAELHALDTDSKHLYAVRNAALLAAYQYHAFMSEEQDGLQEPKYMIWMTPENDVGEDEPMRFYRLTETVTNMPHPLSPQVIFLNLSSKDTESDLGKLIHDLKCTNPEQMFFKRLASDVDCCKHGTLRSKLVMAIEATT